jgi:hypothetical protein
VAIGEPIHQCVGIREVGKAIGSLKVVEVLGDGKGLVEYNFLRAIANCTESSDLAMSWTERPREDLEQRRFAGTFFSHDTDERASWCAERNVRKDAVSPIAFGEMSYPYGNNGGM